jgi:transcriptional regulator with XRE-family HTH domain
LKFKKYKHRLGRQPANSHGPSRPNPADVIACATSVLNDSALLQQFSITPYDWGTEDLYERRYILERLMRHVGWRMFATNLRQSFIWDLAVGMFGISLIEWEDTPLKKPPVQCLAEFTKTVELAYPFLALFFQHTQKVVPFGYASYDPNDIGERLKTLRETLLKDRVISVEDLSKKSGVEVSAIKDIERGATKRPRETTLTWLVQALSELSGKKVPLDEIYPLHLRHQPGRPAKNSPTSEPSAADPQN